MMQIPKSYQRPFAFAIFLHVLILVALTFHFVGKSYRMPGPVSEKTQRIVQATAVSHQQLEHEMQAIRRQKMEKILAEKRRVERIEAKQLAAKRAKLLAILQRHQAKEEKIKQAKLKILLAKQLQQKLIKQAKLKVLLAKQRQLQQKLMKQQFNADQKRLQQIKAAQIKGVVDQYRAQILQKLRGYWHVPPDIDHNLHCLYRVELAPNGVVLSATLIKTSGNPALDRLAKLTIMRASPLPVPKDSVIFDNMRELQLIMTPGAQSFGWIG